MTKTPSAPAAITGTFTNSAGEVYIIHGMSPLMPRKIMASVKSDMEKKGKKLPVVPTYTAIALKGTPEEFEEIREHTEKSILEGTPEEVEKNKAAWEEYQNASQELNREFNARIMKAALSTVQAKPTQAWRDKMKFIGVELPPEGSPEELYLFVETHVILCPADLSGLTLPAFRSAGIINQEMTPEVEATFCGFMERAFIEAGRLEGSGK
jgi:hypothetical protein